MSSKSEYKEAVKNLRERHADKLEDIFTTMYDITRSGEAEDKDRVNAAKVCVSLLGVPRPAMEREQKKPTDPATADTRMLTPEELELIEERLAS